MHTRNLESVAALLAVRPNDKERFVVIYERKEQLSDRVTLYMGDCRAIVPYLAPVDLVLVDPPYGTTQCSWDAVIDFEAMWQCLAPVRGPGVPVAIFGMEPFSSFLRASNIQQFKYDWIWEKPKATGFLNARKQPLRSHEIVSLFCDGRPPYYPQKTSGHSRKVSLRAAHLQTDVYGNMAKDYRYDSTERYPRSVVSFSSDTQNSSVHPTQKPVDLLRYLIRTYTTEGQTVLDFTMGSGTTGVAAVAEGRKFIGVEIRADYFEIALQRNRYAILPLGAEPLHPSAPQQDNGPLFGGDV